ncbi:MAG TPA: phosphopyruvate hydratase [Patescibacteria group bacterium]
MNISKINAYEVLASGGYPTVEARVELENGSVGVASVPYGASAGSHEATVLTDGDQSRYHGKGMLGVVKTIEETIAPTLVGKAAEDQRAIDHSMIALDGTPNKAKLGGNAILAVSLAVARAAASAKKQELFQHIAETFNTQPDYSQLPRPMMVVIEGGKHADNTTDFQEYSLSGIAHEPSSERIRKCLESYHALAKVLKENNLSTNVGNEGAFAPNGIASNEAPFAFMLEAIKKAGYEPGKDIGISLDPATSELYKDGQYHLPLENKMLTSTEMISYFKNWLEKYPIVSIEDPLAEDDWDNWVKLHQICKQFDVQLIGDDLTVTNTIRLQKAIDLNAISAILIKLNQIGSLTETVDTCLLAKQHGMMSVPSHRGGGETNDTAMVDLAVAVNGAYIKVGPTRGERISKYNRLMEIERHLLQ